MGGGWRARQVEESWHSSNLQKGEPGNCRPVSLTSISGKILEPITKQTLCMQLENNAVRTQTQNRLKELGTFGFEKRSLRWETWFPPFPIMANSLYCVLVWSLWFVICFLLLSSINFFSSLHPNLYWSYIIGEFLSTFWWDDFLHKRWSVPI